MWYRFLLWWHSVKPFSQWRKSLSLLFSSKCTRDHFLILGLQKWECHPLVWWGVGYLNEFEGRRKVSFTSLVSLQTSSTQANHQFSSNKQVTNPAIASSGMSSFARVTLSFLEASEAKSSLISTVLFEIGTKECSFLVQGIVRENWKHHSKANYSVLFHNLHCYNVLQISQVTPHANMTH